MGTGRTRTGTIRDRGGARPGAVHKGGVAQRAGAGPSSSARSGGTAAAWGSSPAGGSAGDSHGARVRPPGNGGGTHARCCRAGIDACSTDAGACGRYLARRARAGGREAAGCPPSVDRRATLTHPLESGLVFNHHEVRRRIRPIDDASRDTTAPTAGQPPPKQYGATMYTAPSAMLVVIRSWVSLLRKNMGRGDRSFAQSKVGFKRHAQGSHRDSASTRSLTCALSMPSQPPL
ncbi:hypothetical protein B0H14DRAFT_322343 [Mycena olivaceomarginata]|nr:hypothetical protein B0H14DRAFT_322343 [Mycena olivaceomarginata]